MNVRRNWKSGLCHPSWVYFLPPWLCHWEEHKDKLQRCSVLIGVLWKSCQVRENKKDRKQEDVMAGRGRCCIHCRFNFPYSLDNQAPHGHPAATAVPRGCAALLMKHITLDTGVFITSWVVENIEQVGSWPAALENFWLVDRITLFKHL